MPHCWTTLFLCFSHLISQLSWYLLRFPSDNHTSIYSSHRAKAKTLRKIIPHLTSFCNAYPNDDLTSIKDKLTNFINWQDPRYKTYSDPIPSIASNLNTPTLPNSQWRVPIIPFSVTNEPTFQLEDYLTEPDENEPDDNITASPRESSYPPTPGRCSSHHSPNHDTLAQDLETSPTASPSSSPGSSRGSSPGYSPGSVACNSPITTPLPSNDPQSRYNLFPNSPKRIKIRYHPQYDLFACAPRQSTSHLSPPTKRKKNRRTSK